jgi:hypothetical protein
VDENGFKFPKIMLKKNIKIKNLWCYEDGFNISFHVAGIHAVSTWYEDH